MKGYLTPAPPFESLRAARDTESTENFGHRPTQTESESNRSRKRRMCLAMALDKQARPLPSESHTLVKLALVRSPLYVEFERTHVISYSLSTE